MVIVWGICFSLVKLFESPKYLMGRGKDSEAVEVVHQVARRNGKTSTLTLHALQSIGSHGDNGRSKYTSLGIVKETLGIFDTKHLRPLFATRRLAWSTSLLIVLWGEYFLISLSSNKLSAIKQHLLVLHTHCKLQLCRFCK